MLLIDSDSERRTGLAAALRAMGLAVVDVASILEVERWPIDDVVVTEARSFTPLWKHVGAAHVVVLAETPGDGIDACNNGATTWVSGTCDPFALVSVLVGIARNKYSGEQLPA
jgi:hypothetical protein